MSLLLTLLACSYEVEEFQAEADAAVCDWKQSCFDSGLDTAQCQAEASDSFEAPEGCVYMEDEAKDCVDGLREMPCTDGWEGDDTGDTSPGWPAACGRVWKC